VSWVAQDENADCIHECLKLALQDEGEVRSTAEPQAVENWAAGLIVVDQKRFRLRMGGLLEVPQKWGAQSKVQQVVI